MHDWRHGFTGPTWRRDASESGNSSSDFAWTRHQSSSSQELSQCSSGSPQRQRQVTSSFHSRQDEVGPLVDFGRQVSDHSNGGTSLASSSQQYADPGQTLIFLDWDDTLFPTTEIFHNYRVPRKPKDWDCALPADLERKLEPWREAVQQYLSVACSLSDCCTIVTSSTSPWVDCCIKRFAPNLSALFNRERGGPRVIYAERFSSRRNAKMDSFGEPLERHTCELTAGKLAAMRREAERFYSSYPQQTWKNILSLGDMKYEHDALYELALSRQTIERECLRTKAIILPGSASLSELTLRLQFSRLMLPAYVRYNGNIDLDLRSAPDPLQAIAESLDMPQLGDLPFPRHAWGRTPVPEDQVAAEALAEVAVTVHDSLWQESFREVKVPTFVAGAKTFLSTASLWSNRSARECDPNPATKGLTLEAVVCGIVEGVVATMAVSIVALVSTGGRISAAETLVDFCFACYTFGGMVLVLSTLHWGVDPCVYERYVSPSMSALEARKIYVVQPWAERVANVIYRQALGYRWADSMYVLFQLAVGQLPDLWAKRLLHYVVQSVANACCLTPGDGARARCCLLGIASFTEASLRLASLLHARYGLESVSFSWTFLFLVGIARFGSLAWFVYLALVLRRHTLVCAFQMRLFAACCAHLLNCTFAFQDRIRNKDMFKMA